MHGTLHPISFQSWKGPFCPGSVLALTHFSKNRSQKAQQERAAEAAEKPWHCLARANPNITPIKRQLYISMGRSCTSWQVDEETKGRVLTWEKKVHILVAHCLVHQSSQEKCLYRNKLINSVKTYSKLKLMPDNIMHILLAFLLTHKFFIVLRVFCYSVWLFHVFPLLKRKKNPNSNHKKKSRTNSSKYQSQ